MDNSFRNKPNGDTTMNNTEREQWINNDEDLYNWFKSSRQSMTRFIKENKAEIDACIIKAIGYDPAKTSNKNRDMRPFL